MLSSALGYYMVNVLYRVSLQEGEPARGRVSRREENKLSLNFFVNETHFFQPFKYFCDWIVTDGMTVRQCKELLQPEICQRCGIDVPVEKYVLFSKHNSIINR